MKGFCESKEKLPCTVSLGEDAGRVLEHWVTFLFKKYLQIGLS